MLGAVVPRGCSRALWAPCEATLAAAVGQCWGSLCLIHRSFSLTAFGDGFAFRLSLRFVSWVPASVEARVRPARAWVRARGLPDGRLSSEPLPLLSPLIPFGLSSAAYSASTSEFKARRNKSLSDRAYPCGPLSVLLGDRVGDE